MKYLKQFYLFEEISTRDISYISSELDDYFTISFEFEIETLDRKSVKLEFDDFDEFAVDDCYFSIVKDMSISNRSDKKLVKDTLYNLLDHVEHSYIDVSLFDQIFDSSTLNNERQKEIMFRLKAIVLATISKDDFLFLKRKAKKFLPNFCRKWGRKIEFVGDSTLERGIEIKPKKYVKSISESIELLNDFFSDFNNQDYWKFTERTGLHINIGTNKKVDYNPIKGLLLLNDFTQGDNIPLVFKDMTWRMKNRFCGSLIPSLKNMSADDKIELKNLIDLHNIVETEDILNSFLDAKIREWGFKNYGFNLTKIQENYVEFRYAGGEISKEVLIEKVKYFCFLVYCMTNNDFKRKEYLKKLYKFIDNL